jgi:hypothetical protein
LTRYRIEMRKCGIDVLFPVLTEERLVRFHNVRGFSVTSVGLV